MLAPQLKVAVVLLAASIWCVGIGALDAQVVQSPDSSTATSPPRDSAVARTPQSPVGAFGAIALSIYTLALAGAAVGLFVTILPKGKHLANDVSETRILGRRLELHRELHLLLIVLLMGLTGGSANCLYWIGIQTYHQLLEPSHVLAYALNPWLGGLIALGFYLLLRGGLLVTGAGSEKDINVFGLGGIAFTAGFFAPTVIDKLGAVLH